ncbi:hypothetical protein X474_08630 [Dethiosulfatarculus sandiegensis]|uniref:Uncharacterized protein n=1 Tax=Dethiosulfatarculus sandiegensis TaxID=1429043 RepID=A0A0D2GHD9_9BACT|nr:hypothetical protein X474_08630 [Dethiosulfatarculus sandiegensis]
MGGLGGLGPSGHRSQKVRITICRNGGFHDRPFQKKVV